MILRVNKYVNNKIQTKNNQKKVRRLFADFRRFVLFIVQLYLCARLDILVKAILIGHKVLTWS